MDKEDAFEVNTSPDCRTLFWKSSRGLELRRSSSHCRPLLTEDLGRDVYHSRQDSAPRFIVVFVGQLKALWNSSKLLMAPITLQREEKRKVVDVQIVFCSTLQACKCFSLFTSGWVFRLPMSFFPQIKPKFSGEALPFKVNVKTILFHLVLWEESYFARNSIQTNCILWILCRSEPFCNPTLSSTGGRSAVAFHGGALLLAAAKRLRSSRQERVGTGLCWKWFDLPLASQVLVTTPSAQPRAHTSLLLGAGAEEGGQSRRAALQPAPPYTLEHRNSSDILEIHFLRLLPWPAPKLSCFHHRRCDTERAAHPCLAQARQCLCAPDWHLQAQGKSALFVCSHPWLLLSCLYYLMFSEIIILPFLDWDCIVCWFFLCF